MTLTDTHRSILEACAIDPELAQNLGVCSITDSSQVPSELDHLGERGKGILFPWTDSITGETTPQIRLDIPLYQDGPKPQKYAWPDGAGQVLALVRTAPFPNSPVLLVEGMKQALAVTSTLPENSPYEVLAMAGCWGTSKVDYSALTDRQVTVIFDADMARKQGVWQAAKLVGEQLTTLDCQVLFAKVPGAGDTGIDDVLGRLKTLDGRRNFLVKLLAKASSELPPEPEPARPAAAAPDATHADDDGTLPVFDANGKFLCDNVAALLQSDCALFESAEGDLRHYEGGVYRTITKERMGRLLAGMTGNGYTPSQVQKVWDSLTFRLESNNFFPGELLPRDQPFMNTPSGLVDLRTGDLMPHSRDIYSSVRIGTDYDPNATCPTFDKWLVEMAGDQAENLLEYFAQILDPTQAPKRHPILEGPAGSGKSTTFRIIQSVVAGTEGGGTPLCRSLTMSQLTEAGFHTANLVNVIFNAAGEISTNQLNDITEFKMLTGDDLITANRKNSTHVVFRPRALFAFGMNEFPKVRDAQPYFRRVCPFYFGNQIIGKENQGIEDRIRREERAGVLNRLVQAWQRTQKRGRLPDPRADVLARFKASTSPITEWYLSSDNPFGSGWHAIAEVHNAYRATQMELGEDAVSLKVFSSSLAKEPGVEMDRKRLNGKNQVRAVYLPPRENQPEPPEDDDPPPPPPAPEPEPDPVPPTSPVSNPEVDVHTLNNESVRNFQKNADTQDSPSVDRTTEMLTFDLETKSIARQWDDDAEAYLRLAGWATEYDEPVTTTDMDSLEEAVAEAGIIVGQNVIGFDLLHLHRAGRFDLRHVTDPGPDSPVVLDTMILAQLTDPPGAKLSKAARPYSLENLAKKHDIPIEKDTLKKLAKKYDTSGAGINDPEFTGFDEIPVDDPDYIRYLEDDVAVTREVLFRTIPEGPLEKLTTKAEVTPGSMVDYARREHRVAGIAATTRLHGIRVDRALLEERVAALDSRRAALLSTLQSEYGLPTEGKAPHATDLGKEAIRKALLDMGMAADAQPLTDGGSHSFSGESMNKVASMYPENAELVELCQVVAELSGQRTVYHTVLDHLKDDGRVHPEIDFRQATGRWSITKPGMTVLGKRGENAKEREIFLPDEGELFISADFAQVDARCVAAHSQDPNYMRMFDDGVDLHTEVAKEIFHDASMRQTAKIVSHGWNYGATPYGIHMSTGVPLEEAEAYDKNARQRFPGVVDWQNEVRAQALRGQLLNNGWGRKLRCEPERAHTQAPALVGQSCARDVAMEALLRMTPELRRHFKLFLHDEVLFSVPADHVEEYSARIVAAMNFVWKGIQFTADASKPGINWHDVYSK